MPKIVIFIYQHMNEIVCSQSGFAHDAHLENRLGNLFMASGMVYVHISMKALKLLAAKGVVELGPICNRKLMVFQMGL